MSKLGTTAAVALAVIGLAMFATGIYFMRFSEICAPGESHLICIRSWLSAVGPIIAGAALLVALGQFSHSRDATQRQLRAYVGVADGSIQLVTLDTGGSGVSALVRLRNSGKTPAYDFTTWIAQPVIADTKSEPFAPPLPLAGRTSASIVFADSDTWVSRAAPISTDELASLRDGTKKLFVWGGADYTDAFGQRRTLRYHDINGLEQGQGTGRWGLTPHRKGYQAD